jgi:hypothetical protein
MKSIDSFKKDAMKSLKHINGGEFIHTSMRFGTGEVQDVYFDENGNGKCDDAERKSVSFAIATIH